MRHTTYPLGRGARCVYKVEAQTVHADRRQPRQGLSEHKHQLHPRCNTARGHSELSVASRARHAGNSILQRAVARLRAAIGGACMPRAAVHGKIWDPFPFPAPSARHASRHAGSSISQRPTSRNPIPTSARRATRNRAICLAAQMGRQRHRLTRGRDF